jgi:hypothetical protein
MEDLIMKKESQKHRMVKTSRRAAIRSPVIGCFILSLIVAGCCLKTYPDPVISYDHEDEEGRMYIMVVNWDDYSDELFAEAPNLPPCGENENSSRTWVDIYDAETDERIYGFCALSDNEGLQDLWFFPDGYRGKVYIIIKDRKCDKSYKSNTVEYGECLDSFPNPVIVFDHIDNEGRVYIPVTNWADYSDKLFREAPELPPCGLNTNSARTWVDIYDAGTNAKIYGFCALDSKENLQDIWFMPDTTGGKVYIIMRDRACEIDYISNTVGY